MTRKLLLTMTLLAAVAQASPFDPVARCVKATGHAAVHGVKAVEGCLRKVMH